MSAASNYAENKVLDHLLGTTSYTMPTVYLALFLSDPGEAGGGTEVSGTGYAREAASFGAASGGTASLDTQIDFSAGGDWGEVTHWGLMDASTSGNLLVYAPFDVSRVVLDGDELTLRVGDIDVTLD